MKGNGLALACAAGLVLLILSARRGLPIGTQTANMTPEQYAAFKEKRRAM